jgi:hypothetical protein
MPHHPGCHTMTTTRQRRPTDTPSQPDRSASARSRIGACRAVCRRRRRRPRIRSATSRSTTTPDPRVEPDRVLLDVVVDQAEIPTFQARLDFDTDGDGEVSDEEADAGRRRRLRTSRSLRLGARRHGPPALRWSRPA